eukprot:1133612_1
MAIPEFAIRLCGPTSTSKQIEVATRFGGGEGTIIQLNNSNNHNLTAFSCVWFSRFAGEDKTLFCGGQYRIKIESVRINSTTQNFAPYFHALYQLDCMMTGTLGTAVREEDDDDAPRGLMGLAGLFGGPPKPKKPKKKQKNRRSRRNRRKSKKPKKQKKTKKKRKQS